MSQLFIQQYLNQLAALRKVSGTTRESVLREAFKDLLKAWGKQHNLVFVPEYKLDTLTRDKRYVDGALLYELRVPFGYWEAKDSKDDLDEEIAKKFKRGYPKDNIVFEDTTRAVLIQNGQQVMDCPVDDVDQLQKLLTLFFSYERSEISQFRKAVEQFKADLPAVLEALRDMIARAHQDNPTFRKESERFLVHAQEAINPSLTDADVREMLIQHVLTEEIFAKVFPDTPFHKDNNVARELYKLEATFFTGNTKFQSLKALAPYYSAKLKHKYANELHANEVAILPYYAANLNIEATYAAITGEYAEFPNLCFVDTLDNVGGLRKYAGHIADLFGSVTDENVARIKRQNSKKISVIIGKHWPQSVTVVGLRFSALAGAEARCHVCPSGTGRGPTKNVITVSSIKVTDAQGRAIGKAEPWGR